LNNRKIGQINYIDPSKTFAMPSKIAEYFIDELETWNQNINSYRQQMFKMENKLAEIIQRNTIPNIAELVEEQQQGINKISIRFFQLSDQLEKQRSLLKKNDDVIDDTMISSEIEKHQNALRKFMQQSEKKYIGIKHDCSNFISQTLGKGI
jgi:exonuclease VII large subunit